MRHRWADLVYYDESSPSCLRWAVDRGRSVKQGAPAGSLSKKGYWEIKSCLFDNKHTYCHRIIWELVHGPLEADLKIDHKDGVTSDNKLSNLRLSTQAVNARNSRLRCDNTSEVVGVGRYSREGANGLLHFWVAQWVTSNGVRRSAKFSVEKLGETAAKQSAINARTTAIALLNEEGAGYTERHGT